MIGALTSAAAWVRGNAQTAMAVLVALIVAVGAAYWIGRGGGRQAAKTEQQEQIIEAARIKQRAEGRAASADRVDVCVALGGVRGECERGLRESDASASSE